MAVEYTFSFGPWNVSTGEDPFGPAVRPSIETAKKVRLFRQLGFTQMQFHDDDATPDADAPWSVVESNVKDMKKMLDDEGLVAEFVAPRLWFDPRTVDGGYTSNSAEDRQYALDRSKRAIDIANLMGTPNLVLWLAREGTYCREAKDPIAATGRLMDAFNAMLAHDPKIRLLGEMKPNEPTDQAYLPTPGHFMGMAYRTADPSRVGVLIESAHSILAGLDPSDDMAYTLWHGKLWGVHLNDQNGLKYDQDKSFGAVDLRRAFNQVWVLERGGYAQQGGVVGLDVKAMRTTTPDRQTAHLANSREFFLMLLDVVRSVDAKVVEELRGKRDYEGLERYVVRKLMGRG